MNEFTAELQTIYAACNEHLLEQGHKRDQVIAFYIVLLSFVITSSKLLDQETNLIVVYAGLILVGFVCIRTVADLRSWHQQYIDCMRILNWGFAHSSQFKTVDAFKAHLQLMVESAPKKSYTARQISTDNGVFYGIIVMTAMPVIFITKSFHQADWIAGLVALAYLVVAIPVSARYLSQTVNKGLKYRTWILDFDYGQAIDVNQYFKVAMQGGSAHISQRTGGVVMMVENEDQLLLIQIMRHGQPQWEFPRGFMEVTDKNSVYAARRELNEELALKWADNEEATDTEHKLQPIPELLQSNISVIHVPVGTRLEFKQLQASEGIKDKDWVSPKDILAKMTSTEHPAFDAFTLSALITIESLGNFEPWYTKHLSTPARPASGDVIKRDQHYTLRVDANDYLQVQQDQPAVHVLVCIDYPGERRYILKSVDKAVHWRVPFSFDDTGWRWVAKAIKKKELAKSDSGDKEYIAKLDREHEEYIAKRATRGVLSVNKHLNVSHLARYQLQIDPLGMIQPDSGLIISDVAAIMTTVATHKAIHQTTEKELEAIRKEKLLRATGADEKVWAFTKAEIAELIADNKITDTGTLATLALAFAGRK